jgi:uncharacterized membrane protein YphA (DoxX/SURF4 family)
MDLRMILFGRLAFAISLAVFGIQYIQYGKYVGGLPPVPPWAPGGAIGAYLVGVVLVAAALSLASNQKARLSALVVGGLFLFCVLFLQLQHFSAVVHNGVDRTRAFEPFALAGAAFVLAALLPRGASGPAPPLNSKRNLTLFGRVIFGVSMVVFGWQHFLYAAFLATLVPVWLPAHLFWIYFTGVGMVVAGLAITFNVLGGIASIGLALMFGLWVLVLHGPRVIAQPHNGDELCSLFVALAFCGASIIFAGALPARHSRALRQTDAA